MLNSADHSLELGSNESMQNHSIAYIPRLRLFVAHSTLPVHDQARQATPWTGAAQMLCSPNQTVDYILRYCHYKYQFLSISRMYRDAFGPRLTNSYSVEVYELIA